MKIRADELLVRQGLVRSRSQAADFIKRGKVVVDSKIINKAGQLVGPESSVKVNEHTNLVSRAGEKLASVKEKLNIDFRDKMVLDVGSSTGGFTDLALQNGAAKVVAVDVGTDQMHPDLRTNPRVLLFERTDIRDFELPPNTKIDLIVIDVSFISLRQVLPSVLQFCNDRTEIIALLKPQFEAGSDQKHKGVIKNDRLRRDIIKNFEQWASESFVIEDKSDSGVAGAHGNQERFYRLKPLKKLLK